jgi:SAM-dependent methyltransferase
VVRDVWAAGEAYDGYIGRWSRPVAAEFLAWLAVPAGRRWLDVGCGTGALTATVLRTSEPAAVLGLDTSEGFLAHARASVTDPRAQFRVGDDGYDAVVTGLTLNFVPEPERAAAELARAAAPGATVAGYVWDYTGGGMAMLHHFWDAAETVDPAVAGLDERRRFPLCRPEALADLWTGAGLDQVTTRPIEVPTVFAGFDDYWRPFLGGQGPAAAYTMSLDEPRRAALRELLRERLPAAADGSIPLTARAWAVRGTAVRGTAG